MEDYLFSDPNAKVVQPKTKKKVVAFVVADDNNKAYAEMMLKTLRKFHSEEELPVIVYGQKEMDAIKHPEKYYMATPLFARDLIKEYDLVIKLDADQLFFHDINHIINDTSYDIGGVLNWNRSDVKIYGEIGLATILPQEYINCGFVAMRSEKFINHWWKLCNSVHFSRMPMREQGILNLLYHYGGYSAKCFDHSDKWHGLIGKGEGAHMIMREGKVMLLANEEGYPTEEVTIVAYHWAGGGNEPKMNWRITFSEDVQDYIERLLA